MLRRITGPLLLGLIAPCLVLAPACRAHSGPGQARLAFPREQAHAPRVRVFDVLAYAIELELLPEARAIRAECRVRLQPLQRRLRSVRLDLVGLTVESVLDERGRALAFRREDGVLAIDLAAALGPDEEAELAIRYSGRPERGLWFAGERLDGTGPTLVFSHGQTEGSRGWFPVMGAAAGLLAWAAPERAFEFLTRALELESPHGILTGYLARTLAELPDTRVPAELRRLAADRWLAPSARAVAVDCLAGTSRERLESSRFLASLLDEESFHLRRAAVRALASFDDPGARRALADHYPRARTAEERRIIEALLARAGS